MSAWRARASRWWRIAMEVRRISRLVFERIDGAAVRTFSASIAYHAIVAMVSLITVVLFLSEALGLDYIDARIDKIPPDLRDVAEYQAQALEQVSDGATVALGIIGVLIACWGMASGFAALFDALNRIHGVHRYRSMFRRYARAFVLSVCFSIAFFVAFAMLALGTTAGQSLFEVIGLEVVGTLVVLLLRIASMLVLGPAIFTVLLRYGSTARPPWSECIAAGTVTGVGWVLFSLGLLAVTEVFGTYRGYGSLAIALTLMLYAYWSCYLLLTCVLFASTLAEEAERRRVQLAEVRSERRERRAAS